MTFGRRLTESSPPFPFPERKEKMHVESCASAFCLACATLMELVLRPHVDRPVDASLYLNPVAKDDRRIGKSFPLYAVDPFLTSF
jgi:hypothetical protein